MVSIEWKFCFYTHNLCIFIVISIRIYYYDFFLLLFSSSAKGQNYLPIHIHTSNKTKQAAVDEQQSDGTSNAILQF